MPIPYFSVRAGRRALCLATGAAMMFSAMTLRAQDAVAQTARVIVEAEAESDEAVQVPFLPAVQGTRINSGKKTSVLDFDEFPRINNNNFRQALAKAPGLYVSEETSPLVSIGYRGLDPGRVQFTQVLKDGIPIHADQFGYPEAYYTPSLDTVDRVEFLRGGAALVYGPQPGGSLNFITHRPRTDRAFSFGSSNTFGSDNYYSNFSYLDGTTGPLGYYAYYNHRSGEGFRESNSNFDLNAAHLKLVLGATTDSRLILTIEGYEEQHGEPGGLTFATGPTAVNYNANRNATSRFFDQFRLERYFASLVWEKDFSDATKLSLTGWGDITRAGARGSGAADSGRCRQAWRRIAPRSRTRNSTRKDSRRGSGMTMRSGAARIPSRAACRFITRRRRGRIDAARARTRLPGWCGTTAIARCFTCRYSWRIASTGAHSRSRRACASRTSGSASTRR
jgi:Fe(3+) dicitrate transport protein